MVLFMNELKNIKCILLDIDGTITNSQKEVSDYTISILEEAKRKEIYVILCTGRTNQYAVEKSKICKGSSVVIADNGALIYDYEQDKILFDSNIPHDLVKTIWNISIENNVDCVLNTVYSRYRHKCFSKNNYIKKIEMIDDINELKEEVTQIVINSENYDDLLTCKKLIEQIPSIEINNNNLNRIIKNGSYFCDLNLKGNSKGIAIKKLMNILNLDDKQLSNYLLRKQVVFCATDNKIAKLMI